MLDSSIMSTASQEDMIGRVRLSNNYKIKDSYNTLDYKDDNDAVIKDANDPTKHYKVIAFFPYIPLTSLIYVIANILLYHLLHSLHLPLLFFSPISTLHLLFH